MGKLKSLWNDHRALFLVIVAILLLVLVLLLLGLGWLLLPLLIAAIVLVVVWLAFDTFVRGRKRRKQEELDVKIAAKEGVEDRRREWTRWTKDLRQQGIDRYDLPFYLLVGEPQSGKSVMLHNSGLHFPFGQSRLSGPGGTRGCDWWFTEEAVVLDLAGRLFTHEGGASDAAEWEAFLELLSTFRPLSPANGVLLVIPCDTLLEDSPETIARKAGQIQDSLLTLVGKLEAQLPIYLVLTKADRVFGFAETVHRMDTDHRRQMFGWSRPAEDFEKPFNLPEFRSAFIGLQYRAHLLRALAMSTARIPDALPEIDRLFAFPEEMKALQAPLEAYVQRIFTESSLVDRLFFRGIYLTSGLQKGAPIAKACAALLGDASEADTRDLEGLFTKQRAYFIQDLIQRRVFSERGLVRPTSNRVRRSRQVTLAGYGTAAAIALVGTVWFGITAFSQKPAAMDEYQAALERTASYVDQAPVQHDLSGLITTLLAIRKAEKTDIGAQFEVFENNRGDFRELYNALFTAEFVGSVREAAEEAMLGQADVDPEDCTYAGLVELGSRIGFLANEIDLSEPDHGQAITAILADDPARAELVTEPTGDGQDDPGPSKLMLCIETQESSDFGGSVPVSPVGQGVDLKGAAQGYCTLLDQFAEGAIPRTPLDPVRSTGPSELEYTIQLWALRRAILSSADGLASAGAAITSQTASAGDQGTGPNRFQQFLALERQLAGHHASLEALGETLETLDRKAIEKEYEDLNNVRTAIVENTGASVPDGRWAELGTFLRGEFFSGRESAGRVAWWQKAPEGTAPRAGGSIAPFIPPFGGGFAGRKLRGLVVNKAADAPEALTGPKEELGFLEIAKLEELYPLDAASRAELRALCEEDVMGQVEPRPEDHLTAIQRIWAGTRETPDSDSARVLRTQVADLQRGYLALYRGHDDFAGLEVALVGAPDDPEAESGSIPGIHSRGVKHLVAFHLILVELDPEHRLYADWLNEIEKRLDRQLQAISGQLEAATEEIFRSGIDVELADTVCLLASSFAETIGSLSTGSNALLGTYLDRVQAALLAQWKEPSTPLEGVVSGLRSYLQRYEKLTALPEGHRDRRDRWLRRQIDPLLVAKVQEFRERLFAYWQELALDELQGAELARASRLVAQRIGPGAGFILRSLADGPGSPRFSRVEDDLGVIQEIVSSAGQNSLPGSIMEIGVARGGLSVESALTKTEQLLAEGAFKALADRARAISIATRKLSDANLIDVLRDVGGGLRQVEVEDLGGGIGTYYATTMIAFQEILRGEYAERYEDAFNKEVISVHQKLLRSELFIRQEGYWKSVDTHQVTRLHGLLAPETGALAQFRERFDVETIVASDSGSDPLDEEEAFHPFQDSPAMREFEGFLLELQGFLYHAQPPRTKLRDCNLSFTLEPPRGQGFWTDLASYEWWWPTNDKNSQTEMGPRVDAYSFADWVISEQTGINMAWSKTPVRPSSKPGLLFKVESPLAPLILAWNFGERDFGDETVWDLVLEVTNLDGTIPLQLSFDRVLPPLPEQLETVVDNAIRSN